MSSQERGTERHFSGFCLFFGGVAEWSIAAGCNPALLKHGGSNPSASTNLSGFAHVEQ
jgi:hypothetical protein